MRAGLSRATSLAEGGAGDPAPEELARFLAISAPPPSGAEDDGERNASGGGFRLGGHPERVPPVGLAVRVAPPVHGDLKQRPRRLRPAGGPVPGPASGLLPSNAEAPFRAGHGAMDFGAGPDQYLQSNRSIRRAAAARLSQ